MHAPQSRLVLLALLAALTVPSTARAIWPSDPAVNLPLCTEVQNQEFPAMLPDGSGGVYVVWQDYRDSSSYKVYAQRLSATGAALWGANGIPVCAASGEQLVPHLTSDGAGGAIVTWNDTRALLSDIYAQRLSPGGDLLWGAMGVPLCAAGGPQHDETLVPDGAGGAIVTWWDRRDNAAAVIGDIYAQRVDAGGNVLWQADGVAICTAALSQEYPSIATDGAGGAIIAWTDARNLGSARDIYAQRVSAAGAVQWTANGVALCTAANDQTSAVTVSDGAGGAIVAWGDQRSGADRVYAQRVSAAGAAQWAAGGRPATDNAFGGELLPAILADGAGGVILTWYDYSHYPTSGADIRAQRLGPAGSALWAAGGVAVCDFAGDQVYPAITTDGAGGAVIAWQDHRVDFGNADIYARHLSAAGAVDWGAATKGVAVSTADLMQFLPALASDGAGGAVIAWQDMRGDDTDLYAQRILSDGQLGDGGNDDVAGGPATALALRPVRPNPARGGNLRVSFTLPGPGAATLELLDVSGRRILTRDVTAFGPGSHTVELAAGDRVAPGVYLVRLRHDAEQRATRVAVLR